MKSGVYCLTFSDGSQYVGKTVDFDRRFKEHADSFRKGTAAKNLMAAFNKCNQYPNAKILLRCHADHIDLMETYYICKLQPSLNTVGGLATTNSELDVFENYPQMLQYSTAEHIKQIVKLNSELTMLSIQHADHVKLSEKNYRILEKELEDKKLEHSLQKELQNKQETIDFLTEELKEYDTAMTALEKAKPNIFKRIFKWLSRPQVN